MLSLMKAVKEADIFPGPCETRGAAVPWSFPDVLAANVAPGGTLLDVGCGNGRALVPLASRFDCIIAVDPDKTMLASARQTLRRKGIRNVKVCAGRWQALPVRDASVEAVTSMFSGVHAGEAYRVLKPGGFLLLECVGPPETDPARAARADPQSVTLEFAATLYAALHRYFEQIAMRHALWPDQTRPDELMGSTCVNWHDSADILAVPELASANGLPRMRFIAVCRKLA